MSRIKEKKVAVRFIENRLNTQKRLLQEAEEGERRNPSSEFPKLNRHYCDRIAGHTEAISVLNDLLTNCSE